jgi:hypothetical protein
MMQDFSQVIDRRCPLPPTLGDNSVIQGGLENAIDTWDITNIRGPKNG